MLNNHADINPIIDQNISWPAARCPNTNLVYFYHNKCASSLYKSLFEKLKWEKTDTQQIDWEHDRVFSFIRDPLIKHRKGIVEFFIKDPYYPLIEEILKNPLWIQVLSQVLYIDHHSMSLYSQLGENATLIDFIPIDIDYDHKQHTINLIKEYAPISADIESWFFGLPKIHESTKKGIEFFERLMQEPTHPQVLRYIDYDTVLYEIARIKYSNLR
jgi:hypothetical protein